MGLAKIKITLLIGIFLIFSTALTAAAQEPMTIDLNKAIDLVLQNNETYQIARKEVDRADARIIEALTGALPQITGNVTYIRNWEIPSAAISFGGQVQTVKFGTTNNATAALSVSQPIYNGGRTFTAIKIASTAKKFVHETLHSTREDMKEQTYNAFYGAILAQDVVGVNQESQQYAQSTLDQVTKMYNEGMASEFDYLRAKVAVANIEPNVIKAQNDAEVALSALKNLMGILPTVPIELSANMDSSLFVLPPLDVESAKLELQEKRPEVLMSEYNTKIYKQLISIANSGYRPSLNFSAALQYQKYYEHGNLLSDKDWTRSSNMVLSLSIPIFDSWKTPTVVKQAKIDYTQSRLKEQAVKKGMVLEFEQNLGKYNEARKRLSAQGDAIELARRGLAIANVRFESGVGTQLEVSDARLSLSMAEINRAVAFHDLAVNYAALLRALGRDINPVK